MSADIASNSTDTLNNTCMASQALQHKRMYPHAVQVLKNNGAMH